MVFGLNQPKQGLHFERNRFFRKKIFSCFSCLMVPTKMVQVSFCVLLTIWLEIFLLVLEQSLRSPYVYTVYLVDLLACLTKDQQSSIDICAKTTSRRYDFKAWIPEGTQSSLFNGLNLFSIFFYDYTSQEGLIWSRRMTHENDPRVWSTRMTHEFDPWHWPTRMIRKTHVTHAI